MEEEENAVKKGDGSPNVPELTKREWFSVSTVTVVTGFSEKG
jgi:hypothetical protein